MKRLLITGATGFVGSHACQHFADTKDWEVFGTSFQAENTVSEWVEDDHVIGVNLLEEEQVSACIAEIKPDAVLHLAAMSSPAKSLTDPNGSLTNNIVAQTNLLEAIKQHASNITKIAIIGSSEEYGLVKPSDIPIKETCDLMPTNPYAVSKIAQDYLGLQYYLTYDLPIVRLRPFNHTGERRPPHFVLPAFAKQVAEIEAGLCDPIIYVGNLESIRDFTDVKDMVRAYELALTKAKVGEVYNIGSGIGVKIEDLLHLILEQSKVDITVKIDEERMKPSDNPQLIADASKFQQDTGWSTEIPLSDTISRVLNYWRQTVQSTKR